MQFFFYSFSSLIKASLVVLRLCFFIAQKRPNGMGRKAFCIIFLHTDPHIEWDFLKNGPGFRVPIIFTFHGKKRNTYNFAKMNLIFIYSMLQKPVTSYEMCMRKYILSIYNCALFAKNSATKLDFKLGRERQHCTKFTKNAYNFCITQLNLQNNLLIEHTIYLGSHA